MDIMNVLRTGMNMSISHIHIWLCNTCMYVSVRAGVYVSVACTRWVNSKLGLGNEKDKWRNNRNTENSGFYFKQEYTHQ